MTYLVKTVLIVSFILFIFLFKRIVCQKKVQSECYLDVKLQFDVHSVTAPRNQSEGSEVCQTCSPRRVFEIPSNSIGYFSVMDSMELCSNREPVVDLRECSGYCDSKSSYSHVMQGFTNSCNCCQSTKVESRTVTLTCKSGRTVTKTYSIPTACGCSACSSGK